MGGIYYTHCDLDGHLDEALYVISREYVGIRTKEYGQGTRTKDRVTGIIVTFVTRQHFKMVFVFE